MKSRKSKIIAIVAGITIAAGLAGGTYVWSAEHHNAYERTKQSVEHARQELAALPDTSDLFRKVSRAVEPSVVNINVHKVVKMASNDMPMNNELRQFFGNNGDFPGMDRFFGPQGQPRQYEQIGTGSGVIMEVDGDTGYILTNNHVAGGATKMEITLADGRKIDDAKLVGADPKTDLAVVKINASGLIPAHWGHSSELQQGDRVMAFGSPFGYVGSMTHGIVSALHRQAGILGAYGYEDFIQVDAPINPGNSGGPLVDIRGNVVGINTAIASASGGFQGIGFAIPIDEAKGVYNVLKAHGKMVRGWLGVEIIDVAKLPDQAKAAGFKGDNGVLVKGVMRDAPASDKLEAGDVITSLNGQQVKNSLDLRNAIAMAKPGSAVELGVVRDGKATDVHVKLGEQPSSAKMAEAVNPEQSTKLGMRLAEPPSDLANKYGMDKDSGALVEQVQAGSVAAQAGVQAGDVITRVNSDDIKSVQDARRALSKADLKKGIRLFITNDQGREMLFLQSNQ